MTDKAMLDGAALPVRSARLISNGRIGVCPICGRMDHMSTHHLVPLDVNPWSGAVVDLCLICHGAVHAVFDNRELARSWASVQRLRSSRSLMGAIALNLSARGMAR